MKHTDPHSDMAKNLGIGETAGRPGKLKRRIIWGILMLLLIAFGVISLGMKNGNEGLQFTTEAATRGNLTVTVSATGNLEPTNQVDVGSEQSGTVRAVEADYNDLVTVGQVLARLDSTKLEAEVMKSQAALASAQATLLQAKATVREARSELARLKKVRRLSRNKAVSQSELDSAEAAYDRAVAEESMADAQIAEAEANLNSDQTDLSKSVILSPINGIVLTRSIEPGQTVAASLEAPVLFTLAEDLAQMELHVDVDEADVGQVKDGQEATFTVDAYPDRNFQARITQVRYGSETTDGVVTYETVLAVDNSDLSLRPGMTATADIIVRKVENKILIPNAALRFSPSPKAEKRSKRGFLSRLLPGPPPRDMPKKGENGDSDKKKQRVWTLRNDHPVPVPVTTGVTDGTMTEIIDGDIADGTKLIVDTVSVTS
ncbi:efflux transporter periplasmic adaptor subunit [Desulfonema ishimotonii]|uniref:Efflux transporter periplasmic adaptor subunit n=1 Tax=Desulfonema ishimotonii TaxID=45657 RepID=A0A401FVY6_9BACT|nr:efflux RND transporter periplasmic adaptor subunit [Desulfonema ishimotonii]GBC61137.1 efflux transporter periplasmic adaptor subunit [Desulfonema ishimotonii]